MSKKSKIPLWELQKRGEQMEDARRKIAWAEEELKKRMNPIVYWLASRFSQKNQKFITMLFGWDVKFSQGWDDWTKVEILKRGKVVASK